MVPIVWRVRPLSTPVWLVACLQCGGPFLESTGRFRVNSNGKLHDVWLLYCCPRCSARRKRGIHHRVREGRSGVSLDLYRADDAALAEDCAFALSPGQAVPYAVERPPLPAAGGVSARIEQPRFCGARWDRLLAGELGCSRAALRAAWASGRVRVAPESRLRSPVRHGQQVALWLPL